MAGDKVTIDRTVYTDDLAPEVMNAIEVFKQAVIEECLTTEWRISYCKGFDRAHINRELGFSPCPPLTWAGNVKKEAYPVPELPELTVTFSEAVPEPEKDEEKGLFDRIKAAFV